MKMNKTVGTVLALSVLLIAASAQAASVALNFWGASPFSVSGMNATDTGGGVAGAIQANWNNTGSDGSDGGTAALSGSPAAWHGRTDMVDNTGTATTMDFSFLNPDPTNWGPYGAATNKFSVDATRGSGFASSSAGLQLTQIPYVTYNVYVWTSNDVNNPVAFLNQTGATWQGYNGGESPAVAAIQVWDQSNNVPEPATMSLLVLGGAAALARRRNRR